MNKEEKQKIYKQAYNKGFQQAIKIMLKTSKQLKKTKEEKK